MFANREAQDRSALYFELARDVAMDDRMLRLIATLPIEKQQPNLLFATYRLLYGTASGWREFQKTCIEQWDPLSAEILKRTTQTNEPARCATLLPALAMLPGPLALLELGASAGLCLIPDRYAFSFGSHRVPSKQNVTPIPLFQCRVNRLTPIPTKPLDIEWRLGIDLNPINLDDSDALRWLEACIWPDEGSRVALFRQAVETARLDPPTIVVGDIRSEIAKLAATAPKVATLVVFHSATLSYLNETDRFAVRRAIEDLGATWISNESPCVLGAFSNLSASGRDGDFLLCQDGRPLAWTDPHGTYIEWI